MTDPSTSISSAGPKDSEPSCAIQAMKNSLRTGDLGGFQIQVGSPEHQIEVAESVHSPK